MAAGLCACAFACGSTGDDNNTNDGGGNDGSPTDTTQPDVNKTDANDSGGNPAPPALNMQVDRMGRPAINTALNHTFDTTAAAGTAKDAYNADKNITGWQAAYTAQFAANLGIFDALDNVCGNSAGGISRKRQGKMKPCRRSARSGGRPVRLSIRIRLSGLPPMASCAIS